MMRRVLVGVALAGGALAVVGCGSDGGEPVTVAAHTPSLPDRVVVHRPGLVDTDVSPDEVPVWPGPHPGEFLAPSPPSGESGVIVGAQAVATYAAALDNPGAVWNVGGTVQWLVVDPVR